MKKVKLFLSVAAVTGMTALMGVGSAMATVCTGKVTEMYEASGGMYYVYVTPKVHGSMPKSAVCYCKTATIGQVTVAAGAMAGDTTVDLTGPSGPGTWPNSGYTFIGNTTTGNCSFIDAFPLD